MPEGAVHCPRRRRFMFTPVLTGVLATSALGLIAAAGCMSAGGYHAYGPAQSAGPAAAGETDAQSVRQEKTGLASAVGGRQAGLASPAESPAVDKSGGGEGRRVMVYSAALSLTVGDVEFAVEQALAAAKALGGYLHSREDSRLVVRVPAERFEEAVARFESLGAVNRRHIEAQDVTEEYIDLDARLRAAESVRDRLTKLLASASRVEDALAIEKELARLNGEIDALKAKLDVLRNRVAMSAIALTFERVARTPELGPGIRLPFAWLNELDLGRLVGQEALSPWRVKMMSGTSSW